VIDLSFDFQADVAWWRTFAADWNGEALVGSLDPVRAAHLHVHTDASSEACAMVFRDEWFAHDWTEGDLLSVPDIFHQEFWIILTSCISYPHVFSGMVVLFWCDNEAVVSVINSGWSRDPILMKMLRELHFVCARHSFQILARHIPGLKNKVADALSRPRLRHLAWKFQPSLSRAPSAYSMPSLRY